MRKRKSCTCGSTQFYTEPNQYDTYEYVDGKLVMTDTAQIEDWSDEFILYCADCEEKYIVIDDDYIRSYE